MEAFGVRGEGDSKVALEDQEGSRAAWDESWGPPASLWRPHPCSLCCSLFFLLRSQGEEANFTSSGKGELGLRSFKVEKTKSSPSRK